MTKEALKLALEALAERFSEGWHEGIKIDASDIMLLNDAAQALSAERVAQPEQEPVAWMKAWYVSFFEGDGYVPLYTTPPQRTWVGLTDEEIEQGCKESWVTEQAWQSAVWWTEAKLKSKNDTY
jgi:hypothetical protein